MPISVWHMIQCLATPHTPHIPAFFMCSIVLPDRGNCFVQERESSCINKVAFLISNMLVRSRIKYKYTKNMFLWQELHVLQKDLKSVTKSKKHRLVALPVLQHSSLLSWSLFFIPPAKICSLFALPERQRQNNELFTNHTGFLLIITTPHCNAFPRMKTCCFTIKKITFILNQKGYIPFSLYFIIHIFFLRFGRAT